MQTMKQIIESGLTPVQPDYVFVLLTEKTKEVYEGFVKKAAERLGLTCESFIDFKRPGNALTEVLEGIKKAEILIYDITDFTPNVMWELGVGLTIKDEDKVIVICEKSDKQIPFNIYSHRISFYNAADQDNLDELRDTLIDSMRNIRKTSRGNNPIQSREVRKLVETSIKAIKDRDWILAEVLFKEMDSKEPNNWFIHNQWGIMFRSKNEFETAISKFNQAIQYTNYEDQKANIYIELAILNKMNGNHGEAEVWFKKGEKADSKNNKLYIEWAEFYDELGNYFEAQGRIGNVLARMRDMEPDFEEFKLRHNYYHKKINEGYKKSFAEFKMEELRKKRRDDFNKVPEGPATEMKSKSQSMGLNPQLPGQFSTGNGKLPWTTNWEDIRKYHLGTIVEGLVSGVSRDLGVFVQLSSDCTGLIFWKNLQPGYEKQFSRNQPVRVKILNAFPNPRTGQKKIDLLLAP